MLDQGDAVLSEAELREVHLAAYLPALRAGALTVMASYSSWNGVKVRQTASNFKKKKVRQNQLRTSVRPSSYELTWLEQLRCSARRLIKAMPATS